MVVGGFVNFHQGFERLPFLTCHRIAPDDIHGFMVGGVGESGIEGLCVERPDCMGVECHFIYPVGGQGYRGSHNPVGCIGSVASNIDHRTVFPFPEITVAVNVGSYEKIHGSFCVEGLIVGHFL